jgi:molybdenum cofactor cytidylyltransferase
VIGGIVLAAGEGRRFGGPKQLAMLHGRPLLEYAIEAQSSVPTIERVVVVLGARAQEVMREVDFQHAEPLVCDRWAEGLAASLRAGVEQLADAEAVIVTLGDQPGITPQVVAMILDHADCSAPAARAVYEGRPGHPVLIKRELFPQLRSLRGDVGARPVLDAVNAKEVEAAHICSPQDVDTREDLDAI